MRIRTRFAPSPTGFVHLGNIRSALYPWAFAKKHQGDFILRIEDTDVERSSQEAVDVILDGMNWLGLVPDEGPIFQTHRLPRYQQVLTEWLEKGLAYRCYMSQDELNALRERQIANGENPKYDGTWRPEPGKSLPAEPTNQPFVIRFKNPTTGQVSWKDAVKGEITFNNSDLDDLIIARSDGMPTYNFCVVIDDMDMQITHVIRGDDHVNNTPRQINMIKAMGGSIPVYAHLPTILDTNGNKMSKRNGAMSIKTYQELGYLPAAIINYLARLGWSHGDDEIFSCDQFVEWFDLDHLGKSSAQFNPEKLLWLNQHYLSKSEAIDLLKLGAPFFKKHQLDQLPQATLLEGIDLYKTRVSTLDELAAQLIFLKYPPEPQKDVLNELLNAENIPALNHFIKGLEQLAEWEKPSINELIQSTIRQFQLKMPQLAMPLRVILVGTKNAPAIDSIISVVGRNECLKRLAPFQNQ